MVETFLKIMRRVQRDGACLRYTRYVDEGGYGRVSHRLPDGTFESRPVHRVVYEMFHGPIAPGLLIDHVHANGCQHRDCVRIDHLEAVTPGENVRRGAAIAVRTGPTCKNGHPKAENTTRSALPFARERCRTCIEEELSGKIFPAFARKDLRSEINHETIIP